MGRFDRIIVAICLLWLAGWIMLGVILGASFYGNNDFEPKALLFKAIPVAGVCSGIGCIALIALWPHRPRRRRKVTTTSSRFEVVPRVESPPPRKS
jgi:hypothetical protein